MYVYVGNDPGNGVDAWGKWGYSCTFACAEWRYYGYWSLDEDGFERCAGSLDKAIIAGVIASATVCSFVSSSLKLFLACIFTGIATTLLAEYLIVESCVRENSHFVIAWKTCVRWVYACGRTPIPTPPHPTSIKMGRWIL